MILALLYFVSWVSWQNMTRTAGPKHPSPFPAKSVLHPRSNALGKNAGAISQRECRRVSKPRLIETYFHLGPGYEPFVVCEDRKAAQLNFLPELRAAHVPHVERHMDEVFILCQSGDILVAAESSAAGLRFKAVAMKLGLTYNIQAGVWHNIGVTLDDLIIIVERDNTHRTDVKHCHFTQRDKFAWDRTIACLPDAFKL